MDELDRMRAAYDQLDRYASLVAHDLQAPARRIISFAQLLEDELGQVSQDALDYLGYIKRGAGELADLTAALLEFCRIEPELGPLRDVDLEAALAGVLDELAPEVAASGAVVESGGLPAVLATQALVRSVLRHLLTNALRHHGGTPPRVELTALGSRASDGSPTVRLSVRDHGPGIPRGDRMRAFEPLQRLGGPPSSSSGIGLAVVQRAVHTLGGRVWFEDPPLPDNGIVVVVELPAA